MEPGKKRAPLQQEPTERDARVEAWNLEAMQLLFAIAGMNIEPAAEYIRRQPPSPEAIACLAFLPAEIERKLRARNAASKRRTEPGQSLRELVAASGCKSYKDLWRHEQSRREAGDETCITYGGRFAPRSIRNEFTWLKRQPESS
jgi:hypothetical protein